LLLERTIDPISLSFLKVKKMHHKLKKNHLQREFYDFFQAWVCCGVQFLILPELHLVTAQSFAEKIPQNNFVVAMRIYFSGING
jgi:uncharacterized protein YifN (PemK superfamily)